MSQDLYEAFAERYDRFHGAFGEHDPDAFSFFRSLFRERVAHRVLDCACGTGGDLHLFHSLGCQVVGSDISASMLAQAEANLAQCGLSVPLHRVDYRELPQHFREPFDAVVCLSSSILHMPDDTEVVRAFRSMRGVLREGGILVLTQGTTDKQWKEQPRFILAVNSQDYTRLFVIDYLGQGARYNVLDIDHGVSERGLKVWSVEYPRVLLRDDQERLLRAAGFASPAFYSSYFFAPYDKGMSDRLIAVAER
jgi:SAM-dependent methyltransferase